MSQIKEYKKLGSFRNINLKNSTNVNLALNRIQKVFEEKSFFKDLSKYKLKIIDLVKKELFVNDQSNFKLNHYVAEEIKTIKDKQILNYLFHRYRYEVHPEKNILDNYPPYLQIEPSSICNYRCVFCFETDKTFTNKKSGHMGTMDINLFKNIIDAAEGNIEFLSLASRGEPLVSKAINEMLRYTEGKFLNLKLNTNASLLTEEKIHSILSGGVKTVVFSADAADEKLYSELRVNGNLKTVLKNIELFNEIKDKNYSKSKVITRVSGVKVNEKQNFGEMENFWGKLVNQVAFVDYNPWENAYLSKENDIMKPCSDLWRRMFVWWDGRINPCDTDYKSNLSTGNIKNFDFDLMKSWQSENYLKLRNQHINKKRKELTPCRSCVVT
jgi:radical SAM protein with 4Fe4S-binding SPASM domain